MQHPCRPVPSDDSSSVSVSVGFSLLALTAADIAPLSSRIHVFASEFPHLSIPTCFDYFSSQKDHHHLPLKPESIGALSKRTFDQHRRISSDKPRGSADLQSRISALEQISILWHYSMSSVLCYDGDITSGPKKSNSNQP
ncbi:hypothetical protein C8R43DRAFT_68563 [Mycena crocata]|nr:hypothetical protein C8R43DRAFT_68563 [Mycena crocata]